MSQTTPATNETNQTPYVNHASAAALTFMLLSGLVLALGLAARFLIPATPIDADRADARYKAWADMHAAEETALNTPAWVDQDRQIVRLPIDVAMQITVQEWQNADNGRADLIARAAKAAAPLPKVAPKPSAFE